MKLRIFIYSLLLYEILSIVWIQLLGVGVQLVEGMNTNEYVRARKDISRAILIIIISHRHNFLIFVSIRKNFPFLFRSPAHFAINYER